MRYRKLGRTGLLVSEICVGVMTFGGAGRGGIWTHLGAMNQNEADEFVRTAFDAGVNFFDTADMYSNGESELMFGRAVRKLGLPRDELVVSTKVCGRLTDFPPPGADSARVAEAARRNAARNVTGASRKHVMDAIDASLKRLGMDYVDLYQPHNFDPLTPMEETLDALDACVRAGKVRYIGASNLAAWQIALALGVSDRKSIARFESTQSFFCIGAREIEREIVPLAQAQNLGLLAWGPLAAGFFGGRYARDSAPPDGRRTCFDFPYVNKPRAHALLDTLRTIASAQNISVAVAAIAWALRRPWVTSLMIGAKTPAQLRENLGALAALLTPEQTAALDNLSALEPEYPGWITGAHVVTERRDELN